MAENDFWEEQLRNWVEQSSNKNSARALPPKTMSEALNNRSKVKRMSLLPYPRRGADGSIDMTDWVAPQVAIDLIESAQLPGQVYRGEKAGTPKEARKMAVDVNFGSALLGRGAAPAGALGMNVWHGGPNKWAPEPDFPQGRPRLDKMGTGEGNQAYGHGFYSAQAKDVGQGYHDALKPSSGVEAGSHVSKLQFKSDLFTKVREKYPDMPSEEAARNAENATSMIWRRAEGVKGLDDDDGTFMRAFFNDQTKMDDALSNVLRLARDEMPGAKWVEGEAALYKLDLPDEDVAKYLDWDAPLSEQGHLDLSGLPGNVAPLDAQEASQVTGERLYKRLANALGDRLPSDEAASKAFRKAGIPGLKYFDGMSRNKPLKEIKRDFLDALPEDADMEDVSVLFGKGHFKPDQEAVLKALEADDWLGFDYPSQAISAAFSPSASNWDMSPALVKAIAKAKEDGTRNYVTWDQDVLDRTKMLERNGDELGMGGGPLSAAAALQKQYEDEQLLKFLETGA
jgi:hypothetical protein